MGEAEVSRRELLVGGVCVLAVLGGCTGRAGGSAPSGGSGSPTGGSGPAGAPPSPAASHPAGWLADLAAVPVGGGQVSAEVLLVQSTPGEVKAYDARCPHAGVLVGTPDSSGVVTCPGHFARYRSTDGSLIDGPSPRGLRPIPVQVVNGQVLRVR